MASRSHGTIEVKDRAFEGPLLSGILGDVQNAWRGHKRYDKGVWQIPRLRFLQRGLGVYASFPAEQDHRDAWLA